MPEQPRIRTERLWLRPFELADAPAVQRLAGEREIASTTGNIPHPYEDGMAEEWIGKHRAGFEHGERSNFAIELSEENELIGSIGLAIDQANESAGLGYWIGLPYWNRGYATETGRAMLEYGFGELGLNRIHAGFFSRNPASGRVMEKLGMRYEGCLRQAVKKWGIFEDLQQYAILRQEFGA
jgi:RimJ/RimL family protein N-acetyltransferase